MPNQASMVDVPTLVVILCSKVAVQYVFGNIFDLFQ